MSQALKNYCLQTMGITTWQRRERSLPSYDYLLLLEVNEMESDGTTLSGIKLQLIERILQALHWPLEKTRIEFINKTESMNKAFEQKISLFKPKKVLLFSPDIGSQLATELTNLSLPTAVLPVLKGLLANQAEKKHAWQLMKPLMN